MNTTLIVGYSNHNGQKVLRPTVQPANDPSRFLYVLECLHCWNEYGADGTDIHLRKCPKCQGGQPALPI
jgi:hypothetical protein